MNTAKKTSENRSLQIRITAAVLAVIMLSSAVLYQRSGVVLKTESFEEKSTRIAAGELLRGDEYANSTTLERMTAYIQNLMSGRHTQEEIERGVQISIAQANYQDAILLTEKALEIYEGDREGLGRLQLRLGYLHVMVNDPENALKWLNSGIGLAPSPEAYLTRAQVLLTLDQTDAALKDVTIYLNTAENAEELMPDLINIYEAAGDYETAASLYTRLIDLTGDQEFLLNRAYCRTSLGQMDQAETDRSLYEEAKGVEIASADVMLGIGWMRGGEYTRAGTCFARAIEEKYADPESLYYYVVLCAYVSEDYERACEYGDLLVARVLKGQSTGTADFAVEKTTGRLNVKLAKVDIPSLCLMTGASHIRRGDYEQAVDNLSACLATDQGVVYANYLRGICLMAAERYDEAIVDLDTSIAAEEELEKSHYSRGVCRMMLEDITGAMEDFNWVLLNGTDDELFEEASIQMARFMQNEQSTDQPNGASETQED